MSKWTIVFSNSAEKFIKKLKLKTDTERILFAILQLQDGPYALPYKKIQGIEGMYRIRVGEYRITYEAFENQILIKIIEIGRRENIYD